MKRWGILITAFYFAVTLLLFAPGFISLVSKWRSVDLLLRDSLQAYQEWWLWLWVGIIVGGQALLLFLSVDTSWRHSKPRQHVAVTAALTSFFAAVLTGSALFALEVGVAKGGWFVAKMPSIWIGAWILWGVLFYQYYRDTSIAVSAAVSWLLKGSVLELLVAVPAHVIVRQRGDCSAPLVTSFGIVTGIAIMLLCFGPGVLALYKKKLDAYARRQRQNA
ncbi:MAG: hypothetical protein HY322_08680 [Betaproteobacteria bacterium]|nr:hypothetical protein [Betaproteobacteria bacterium]